MNHYIKEVKKMKSDDYWYQVKKGALDDRFLMDESFSEEEYKKESDLLDLIYGQKPISN
tara:strand:- start:543 stop:719 length:177 start_codon:yes stop_codon:yes gene_type:complete